MSFVLFFLPSVQPFQQLRHFFSAEFVHFVYHGKGTAILRYKFREIVQIISLLLRVFQNICSRGSWKGWGTRLVTICCLVPGLRNLVSKGGGFADGADVVDSFYRYAWETSFQCPLWYCVGDYECYDYNTNQPGMFSSFYQLLPLDFPVLFPFPWCIWTMRRATTPLHPNHQACFLGTRISIHSVSDVDLVSHVISALCLSSKCLFKKETLLVFHKGDCVQSHEQNEMRTKVWNEIKLLNCNQRRDGWFIVLWSPSKTFLTPWLFLALVKKQYFDSD